MSHKLFKDLLFSSEDIIKKSTSDTPFNIAARHGRDVTITTSDGSTNVWKFDKDGVLTIPAGGSVVDSDGNQIGGGGNVTTANKYYVAVNADGNLSTSTDGVTWSAFVDVSNNVEKCATDGNIIILTDGGEGPQVGPLRYTSFADPQTVTEITSTSVGPSVYTDDVTWRQVDYANGHFVAVGSATNPDDSTTMPIAAYSADGITWSYFNFDINSILSELDNGNYTYNGTLLASDVVYNGTGWAISLHDLISSNAIGGIYITDLTALINSANVFWMADMSRIIWTGAGWIGWNNENYGSGFSTATDPRVGMFDGPINPLGSDYTAWLDGVQPGSVAETAGGKIGDISYAVWSTGSGQIIWTTDFGATWNFSVPLPTINSKTGTYIDALTFAGDRFYIGNDDEQIFYSTDLITWTKVDDQDDAFAFTNDLAYCVKYTTSVAYDRLVKGDYAVILDADGNLNLPAGEGIGFIQTKNDYPTLLAYGANGHGGPELDYAETDDRTQLYNPSVTRHAMWINNQGFQVSLDANSNSSKQWIFHPNGTTSFPGNITVSGNTLATTTDVSTAVTNLDNQLSDVAKSGSFLDLTDVPSAQAFDGNYNSLSNKPTIPTLTSQLTNDSGFLTSAPTDITGNAGTVTNGVYTTGTQTIAGQKTFISALGVNSSNGITTNQTTFPLINANATTVNFAGAATAINMGAGTGTTTINHDLHVAGDITFTGTSTTLSATNLDVTDSLIYLSINNAADILDIGWVGAYVQSSTHKHTGLVRDASDSKWKLFSGITAEPTTTVDFTGATYDTLKANLEGNVTGNLTGDVVGNVTGNVSGSSGSCTGNAATVTNGVYTNSTYANPAWITSLAASKLTGSIGVSTGGTGVSTITGYIKGNGTSAFTGSSTIPNTDITGLGTMSTQASDSVSITGGSITGLSEVGINGGTFVLTNNSSSTAMKITQTGTGNAFLVEDSASTDSTPFVIDNSGNVAIGAATASAKLDVIGNTKTSTLQVGTNPAGVSVGVIGIPNQKRIYGRNAANTADVNIAYIDGNNALIIGPSDGVSIDANGNLLPTATATYSLGSNSYRWSNIYTGDLHLSNESKGGNDVDGTTGNWTIQEGSDTLFIINNKTGKKYKFALEEIV